MSGGVHCGYMDGNSNEPKNVNDNKLKYLGYGIFSILFLIVLGLSFFYFQQVLILDDKESIKILAKEDFVPQKTVHGKALPPGFLTAIPSLGTISQSYTKVYQDQVQMSVVYYSENSASNNFSVCESFLKENNWKIAQNNQNKKISILQATKDRYRLDLSIIDKTSASSTIKSHIIINLFRK